MDKKCKVISGLKTSWQQKQKFRTTRVMEMRASNNN